MTCQTTHRPNHCLRKNCQIVLHKVTQGLLNFASTFFLVWFNSNCLQISENIIAKYQYFAVLGSMTSTAIHKIMDNNLLFFGQFSCHKVSLLYLKMPITRLETYSLDFVSRLSTTSMLSRLDFLLAVTNLHQILVRFEILIKLKIKNKEAGIIYEGRLSWIHFIVTYCHFASQWVKNQRIFHSKSLIRVDVFLDDVITCQTGFREHIRFRLRRFICQWPKKIF